MYHGICVEPVPSPMVGTDDPSYVISPDAFLAQLHYLRDSKFEATSLQRYFAADRSRKTVVITFDDGNKSDIAVALPLLKRFGFTATFYITTSWIGRPGFMAEADIRGLDEAGMEVGSHGHTHTYFDEMSVHALTSDVNLSVSILQSILGKPICSLGAPGGRLHPRLEEVARNAGLTSISTSRPGLLNPFGNRMAVPRMPVKRDTTVDDYRRMVCGDSSYYGKHAVRSIVLTSAKRILGNRRYEQLRAKLSARS